MSTGEWLLLGSGLSTFSWLVFGLFVAFVAAFQWRASTPAMAEPRRFNMLQLLLGALAVIAIVAVVAAVPGGLLAHPDMRIHSSGPGYTLSWFLDRTSDALPRAGVLSVSLWWYKIAMLAWALWLSFALTRWVRWAWQIYARDGLWRGAPRTPRAPEVTPPDTGAAGYRRRRRARYAPSSGARRCAAPPTALSASGSIIRCSAACALSLRRTSSPVDRARCQPAGRSLTCSRIARCSPMCRKGFSRPAVG